ncbi:MAG: acyl-CoA dehydrogenase family protein [Jatrophihabitantaceae bacterium]
MAGRTSSQDQGSSQLSEPGVTPEEIVRRAEAIAPTLVERQAETEQRTFYAPDTHETFLKAGFYRILVPRRYGGYEFGPDTFLRVTMALARGCPSTGWMYSLGAAHALNVASLFSEQAQEELFASGDFICPAVAPPSGSAHREQDGKWRLDGTWNYCSGAPYATHFLGHTLVPSDDGALEPMAFVVPRSGWERLDDWGQHLGLRGSGSHSITISGAVIEEHLALRGVHVVNADVSHGTPGLDLHGNPQFAGGLLSWMCMGLAALAVGIAQGALDAYEELMRTKMTFFPPIVERSESLDYQLWHGSALRMVGAAQASLMGAAQQWVDACGAFTQEANLDITAICTQVIEMCWRAVEGHLFRTAGTSALRQGERIERLWRDLSMLYTHAGPVFLASGASREHSKSRLGLDVAKFA